jgi:hypothetical protein
MSFARRQRASCLALAVAVALGLSACSSSTTAKAKAVGSPTAGVTGNSATALFQQLRASSAAAKSVQVRGAISNGATATGKSVTAQIDIAGDPAGKNSRAIINDGTGVVELLTVGGKTYRKADTAWWTKNYSAAAAKRLAGKYTLLSAGSAAAAGIPTVAKLLDQIYASASGNLNTTVVKTSVKGTPAYLVTTKANDTKIYVSTDGAARLLRVEGSGGQLSAWDFTDWNAVPPLRAPVAGQLNKTPNT